MGESGRGVPREHRSELPLERSNGLPLEQRIVVPREHRSWLPLESRVKPDGQRRTVGRGKLVLPLSTGGAAVATATHLPLGTLARNWRSGLESHWSPRGGGGIRPVSYTHLTLPTICSV